MNQVDTTQTLAFESDRSQVTTMLLLSATFAALGLWFVISPETFAENLVARALSELGPQPSTVVMSVGVLAICLVAVVVPLWYRHRRSESAAVRLSPAGLSVGVGPAQFEELPWIEITGTQILSIASARMLGIFVADTNRVLEQQGLGRRVLGWMNASSFGTPVYVPANMVKAELDDVAEAIEAYRAVYAAPRPRELPGRTT